MYLQNYTVKSNQGMLASTEVTMSNKSLIILFSIRRKIGFDVSIYLPNVRRKSLQPFWADFENPFTRFGVT